MRVQEFRSSGTFAGPFVGQSIQCGLIESNGAPRIIPRFQDAVMNHAAEKKSHHDKCESDTHQRRGHPAQEESPRTKCANRRDGDGVVRRAVLFAASGRGGPGIPFAHPWVTLSQQPEIRPQGIFGVLFLDLLFVPHISFESGGGPPHYRTFRAFQCRLNSRREWEKIERAGREGILSWHDA